MERVRVALLGCGSVGSQVAAALAAGSESVHELSARAGATIELVGVAVRDASTPREGVDDELLTTDAEGLVTRADVVVELIGGLEPARSLLLKAFEHGASVVTGNKALLAAHGRELHAAADAAGVDLYFEAAVAGAIPIIRPLRESLAGDRVERVLGIVNGTTNFVLDEMDSRGASFDDAVSRAQELGYAEADPTADVDGWDAAAKAAILATLAFHTPVTLDDVHREGIRGVSAEDVAAAREAGAVVKLLAVAERTTGQDDDGAAFEGVQARVHPVLLSRDHPLASVRGAYNAVFVEAAGAGDLMFYGQGAGGRPTASAVLGDLVTLARHRQDGSQGPRVLGHADLPVLPTDAVRTRYQVRLVVADRPGVLAAVAQAFAAHGVSIETVRQRPSVAGALAGDGGVASLVVVTHTAADAALAGCVADLSELDAVASVASVLRVEGDS
ncbi:homoserine dehydrogenase [Quadrisphaera granulorum]|uniref:Homoserine dehydrogenase n=1 Tax=Quadrisphaera granulorum TaxID=317664 RepID=A0A316AG91_9ACTN|nr:homoserine dehydrogenase [Quadrisphaera granulorum]PWJ56278.1 homoserine dehydrogenase [Quadrisphaera granulorum]SZE94912.1 homoserine dehydrogenase [Quadrisphaera granulorum]